MAVLSLDDGIDGSKKIDRNSCAPVGGCIRLAGTGGSFGGETLGCPLVAQPEIASAQLSDSDICLGLRILLVLFVLLGDGLELLGLGVFGCPRLFRLLQGNVQLSRSLFGSVLTISGNSGSPTKVHGEHRRRDRQHGEDRCQVFHFRLAAPVSPTLPAM